jgi:hypothetical protein
MKDWNTCFAYLNMELPDDIRRLKEAGYYDAAIARIDACLAEDWTASQNQPLHPQGALPVNPTPHGVDAWRQGLLAHREILRRLPQDYTLTAEQLLAQLQATLRDFTAEEFAALDAAGQMDWRFVEGQKRYIYRAAETLVATHPDLAARQLDPPVPERSWDRFEPQHDRMVRTGAASADITLRASIGMTDETFARALAAAKAEGRDTVHVKVWLACRCPLPARHRAISRWTALPRRPPISLRRLHPSALRTGRQTLLRTAVLARSTATAVLRTTPLRWKCRPTPCSRFLTPPSSCPILPLPPI